MNQYDLRQITPEEFEALDYQFFQVDSANAEIADELWQYYHAQFSVMEVAQIEVYHETFWKFYVYLTWQRLSDIPTEQLKLVFAYQTFDACRLGFDLFTEIVRSLALGAITKQSQMERYSIIRSAIMNSPMTAGVFKEKRYTIADLINEIGLINSKDNDTMQITEFRLKLSKLLFPDGKPYTKNLYVDMDTAGEQFFGLVHFLMGVADDKIWVVVDDYIDNLGPPMQKTETEQAQTANQEVASEPNILENSQVSPQQEEATTQEETPGPTASPKPTKEEIIAGAEANFEKDEQGHFKDLEQVFTYLQYFANEYNDESFAELLYFDEASGTFKWAI